MVPGEQTIGDVGEFGLIDRIAALVQGHDPVVGIGDDCAVIDIPGPEYLLATVDMLVEDVHFRRATIDPFDLGRRAMAVNLSDIAAMGGRPTFALTSLALPTDTTVAFVETLYRGMRREAEGFGTAFAGGNLTRIAGPMALDVTLLGHVAKREVALRSGAKVGDILAVTGSLGDAAAARHLLDVPELAQIDGFVEFHRDHAVPTPRVEAGQRLASAGGIHAMLDISDGLGSDVRHLAGASNVGAVIYQDHLPISVMGQRLASSLGVSPHDLALYGGEDYELLVALPPESLSRAQKAVGQLALSPIGAVLEVGNGVVLERSDGEREPLEPRGWTHF